MRIIFSFILSCISAYPKKLRTVLSIGGLLVLYSLLVFKLPDLHVEIINQASNKYIYIYSTGFILCLAFFLEKTLLLIKNILLEPLVNFSIATALQKLVHKIHQKNYGTNKKYTNAEISSQLRRVAMTFRSFISLLIVLVSALVKVITLSYAVLVIGYVDVVTVLLLGLTILAFYISYRLYIKHRLKGWEVTDNVASAVFDSLERADYIVANNNSDEAKKVDEALFHEANVWEKTMVFYYSCMCMVDFFIFLFIFYSFSVTSDYLNMAEINDKLFLVIKTQLFSLSLSLRKFLSDTKRFADSLYDIKKLACWLNPSELSKIKFSTETDNDYAVILFDKNNTPIFKVGKNEKIAIVGTSGVGKTRLIRKLVGRFDSDYSVTYGVEKVMYIPQNLKIVNGTIRDNLDPYHKYTDIVLHDALSRVGLNINLSHFDSGLDTVVGDKGISLSSGELQKMFLAKAMIEMPQILIADEPTSNLDYDSENKILAELMKLIPAMVWVTHRVHNLEGFDDVVAINSDSSVLKSTPVSV